LTIKRGSEKGFAEVDGRVVETSREYVERTVYDDHYNLVRKREYVGEVDFGDPVDEEDEEPVQYCPHCLKFANILSKLGPRSWKGQMPVDNDLFCQCFTCGNIYGVHEIAQDSQLKNTVETLDNAFESNQTEIESIPKRTSPAGKKATAKRKRERNRPHHKDPEIDALMRIYGDRVKVVTDSDP